MYVCILHEIFQVCINDFFMILQFNQFLKLTDQPLIDIMLDKSLKN